MASCRLPGVCQTFHSKPPSTHTHAHARQDAATYLLGALCALGVPRELGVPGAGRNDADADGQADKPFPDGSEDVEVPLLGRPRPDSVVGVQRSAGSVSEAVTSVASVINGVPPPEDQALARLGSAADGGGGPAPRSFAASARAHLASAAAGIAEGWAYVLAPENRDVLGIATIKAAGSLTWGPIDIVNVG